MPSGMQLHRDAANRRPTLAHLLVTVSERCRRRAGWVAIAGLVLALGCAALAATRLGITTDTDELFSSSLPWRRQQIAFDRAFPQFRDLSVFVVDATSPEDGEDAVSGLVRALAADPAHFRDVRAPDANPFLIRNGLLFLDPKTLGALLDRTIDAQPFLGQLVSDPSARGLFATLALLAVGIERGEADVSGFSAALDGFHRALADAVAGHPTPLSWERLLGGSVADLAGPHRIVLARTVLDHGALEPGGVATAAARKAIAELPTVRAGRATVRITGPVALSDEEFATVAEGAAGATLGSALVVTLWLVLAVRSWRLIVPILATLVLGVLLTTGFAALAVGTLNLISVAFAVLFVGIAVDFSIQYCVRYRERRHELADSALAFAATARSVGPQVLVAAVAAAAGFLAFVPTDFSGVAELGLIAGVGMLIAFAATTTFLPAILTLFRPRDEARAVGFAWGDAAERGLIRARIPVLIAFAAAALLGALLVPRLTFDGDPLHTKNPNTEAMRTLTDLMSDPLTSPYSVDAFAASAPAADALAEKLGALPLVAQVVTLGSFVPTDQDAKLALIDDANSVLAATLAPRQPAAPVTAEELRMAARTAEAQIREALPKLAADSPLRAIAADLADLVRAPDATLLAANAALTRYLPRQLDRLRAGLDAHKVALADLPDDIVRDWRLPDGRVRVEAAAKPVAYSSQGLADFVAEVRSVDPDAGGSAVGVVEASATIVGAFRTAAIGALLAIAVLLAVTLGRLRDALLVLGALVTSAMLTVVVAVLLPMPLNFANIIALPLLLGVGVSFNIYFVMNWRAGMRRFLGTATARAILFSALTTGTAFGSLALSRHPGTASMGEMLLISLGCTLLVTLVALPALLTRLGSGR
jgi:hopanoid biosynthesis associated RND transporter like protein HpnN